jgi:hypothetical protein
LETADHVLVAELHVGGVVVDDGEEGAFGCEQGDDVVVGGGSYVADLFLQSVLFEDDHFVFEDVHVVLFEEFLVGEVDAELLEGVVFEVLKAEDVEQVDGFERFIGGGVERDLYFVDDELEDGVVYGFGERIAVADTALFAVCLEVCLLQDYLLLERKHFLQGFGCHRQNLGYFGQFIFI